MKRVERVIIGTFTVIAITLALSGCSKEEKETGEKPPQKTFVLKDDESLFTAELPQEYKDVEKREQELDTSLGKKVQNIYIASGEDMIFMVATLNIGMEPGDKEEMVTGLKIARMNYAQNATVLDEGQTEIDGYIFLTGRYKRAQDNQDMFLDIAISHIGQIQFILQALTLDEKKLDDNATKRFFQSFQYTGDK